MKEKIKLSGTESFLMRIADHLRKNMEESEYKEYIFDLLFLKRMSDVFEEKREQVIALASVLHTDEKELLTLWLADQIKEITDTNKDVAEEAMEMVKME